MVAAVPSNEPTTLVAGDTWKWTRTLEDYPASTWTLTYFFTNAAANFSIVASADGDVHSVTDTAATTAAYTAGSYRWEAYVVAGTERYRVDYGSLEVLPNLATAGSVDRRSHWQIVLDNVEAVLQDRATKDQMSYSIAGRSLQRMSIGELTKLYGIAKGNVKNEAAAEAARNGNTPATVIKARFTRP